MLETFRKYFRFGGSYAPYLRRGMVWSVLNSFAESWQILALATVLFALSEGTLSYTTALTALCVMLVSIAGMFVTGYFKSKNFCYGNFSMVGEKRTAIGDKMRYLPMGYYNESSLGDITSAITNRLEDVQNAGGIVYTSVISGFVFSVIMVVMLVFFDWHLGLLCVAAALLFLLVNRAMQAKSREVSDERVASQGEIVDAVLEFLQGMPVVRTFSMQGRTEERLSRAIDVCEDVNLKAEMKFVKYAMLQLSVTKAASVAVCLSAAWLWSVDAMETGTALVAIVCSFMVFGKLELTGIHSSLLRQIDRQMSIVNELIDTPVMVEGSRDEGAAEMGVTLEDVSFSYGDRTVIDHVTFSVPPRSSCAIVGPSGSGKTTLTRLMARFWDVDSGVVTVDGTDVRAWQTDALLGCVSMVFQDVYLFDDTVENNIKMGNPEATHEQVVRAARRACCHDFISELPEGYDTRLAEGGKRLSGGERQRISIARAMLKDAPIVILDEATANVDPENERDLQLAIEALTKEKTVITIAHRLNTVRNADQIVVLDAGRLVQKGTHDSLMEEDGVYADFVGMRQNAIGWRVRR